MGTTVRSPGFWVYQVSVLAACPLLENGQDFVPLCQYLGTSYGRNPLDPEPQSTLMSVWGSQDASLASLSSSPLGKDQEPNIGAQRITSQGYFPHNSGFSFT